MLLLLALLSSWRGARRREMEAAVAAERAREMDDKVAEMNRQQAELNGCVEQYESLYRSVIREGIEAGEFIATDGALAAYLMLGAQVRLCAWYRPEGRLSPGEIADTFSVLLVRSLAVAQLPAR